MVDKNKFLKIESPSLGGTETDYFPTEADPTEDYVAAKGVALENSDNTTIRGDSGVMKFKDSVVTTEATLQDAIERLKLKTVDLTNLINGYVLTWNNSLLQFELQPAGGSGGGSGVTPPFFFSKSGNATPGTYLRTGEAVTSETGQTIVGDNKIVKMVISNGGNVGINTIVRLQRRTAVTTFSDIAGSSITITSGNYKATLSGLNITLNTDEEISAYVVSGDTLKNPVLGIYVIPA